MLEFSPWLRFLMAALATWRITHLLAREDGPANLLARLRLRLGSGFFGSVMHCFYCLSLWVAAPTALFVRREPADWLLTSLALSGAACLLERFAGDPVIIQPLSQSIEEKENDAMLRSNTNRGERRDEPTKHTGPIGGSGA